MQSLQNYFDQAKLKTGSDRQTGLRIGMSASHMSIARKKGQISPENCAKLAEVIDVDPLQIIAAAEVAKHPEKKNFWSKWTAASVILSVGIMTQGIDSGSELSHAAFDHAIYYAHFACAVVLGLIVWISKNGSKSIA